MNRSNPYPSPAEEESNPHRKAFKSNLYVNLFIFLFILISISGVWAVGTYPAVDNNQVLYYHFNNDSGVGESYTSGLGQNRIYDYSNAHLNNATSINNITYNNTGGYLSDGAFQFDGINDYINVSYSQSFNITNFTLSFYYKFTEIRPFDKIFSFYQNTTNRYYCDINTNRLECYNDINNSNLQDLYYVGGVTVGTWYNLIINYNGTHFNYYLDGLKIGSGLSPVSMKNLNNFQFLIGNYVGVTGNFSGSFDDFILWNKTLSDKEIQNINTNYGGCYTPVEDLQIDKDKTLCQGTYYLNDSNTNGVIIFTKNDTTLDCNGSIIIGNSSQSDDVFSSKGIHDDYFLKNIIIKNCNFNNFKTSYFMHSLNNITFINCTSDNSYYGFDLEQGNNVSVLNSKVTGFRRYGIYVYNTSNYISGVNISSNYSNRTQSLIYFDGNSNQTIVNNSYFYGGLLEIRSNFITISNSIFNLGVNTSLGCNFLGANNILISNNSYYGYRCNLYVDGDNNIIQGNYFFNITGSASAIGFWLGSDNNTVFKNIINISDIGIFVTKSTNINITNNTILSSNNMADDYASGIFFDPKVINATIQYNIITNFGTNAIGLKNATNVNIFNNTFSTNVNSLFSLRVGDWNEPQVAIGLYGLYKGYSGEGLARGNWTIEQVQNYFNKNINISGNTFNGINVYLQNVGTINLTTDLTNYYLESFEAPYFSGKHTFYINKSFDFVFRPQNINYDFDFSNDTCFISSLQVKSFSYSIHRNYSYFQNVQDISLQPENYPLYLVGLPINSTFFILPNQSNKIIFGDNKLYRTNSTNENYLFFLSPLEGLYSYNITSFNTTKSWTNALFFYPNKSNVDPINRKLTGYFNVEYLIDPSINMTYAYDNFAGTPQSMEVTDSIDFYLCNSSNTFTILNFTFVDETNSSNKLNGTINEAYFTYYPDLNPSVVKTYSFISSINSENFSLCITPKEFNYSFNYTLIYSGNGYGTKTKATNGYTSYQNISNNIELPLLNSTNIVTFQVINTFNQQIEGVYAYVLPYLNDTILSSGYTDSGGIIQFLLQNGTTYRLYFSKSGYDSYSTIQNIGDTFYTITLNGLGIPSVPSDGGGYTGGTGGGTSSAVPNSIGVTYKTYPLNTWLNNGTYYYFNFSLNSGSWNFTNWGFNITDQSNNLINATSSTNATGGNLGLNVSTNNYTRIVMNFYYVINGNRTNLQRTWLVLDTSDNQFSIAHAIDDTTNYVNSGLFGITGFGVSFIVFFIIFIGAGVLSYKYGLTSPTAICGFVFAAVWFFDVYLNWIPTPIGAVQHFTTIIIGIVLFGMIVREVAQ